jgi:uncharacterized SAM-binding protein YcdF (DUF218 family)
MPGALIEWWVFPPGGVIILVLLGLLLWRWLLGRVMVAVAIGVLWAATTPAISFLLIDSLQWKKAANPAELAQSGAEAIVVLGGGRSLNTPDYGDTVGTWSLLRLRYAAWLQKEIKLPIAVTAGAPNGLGAPEAPLMKQVLEDEFGAKVIWTEQTSRNTHENARFTRNLLERYGIRKVVLVTHALHMRRALSEFRNAGFDVIPAPTDFIMPRYGLDAWMPGARTLYQSSLALHELVGGWWYRLRYPGAGHGYAVDT